MDSLLFFLQGGIARIGRVSEKIFDHDSHGESRILYRGNSSNHEKGKFFSIENP
ncbi:hypothetical protein ES705_39209 [subsurface metagenome]